MIHLKFGQKSLKTLLMLNIEGWEDALNAVTVAMLFQQHERKEYFQWVAIVTMT